MTPGGQISYLNNRRGRKVRGLVFLMGTKRPRFISSILNVQKIKCFKFLTTKYTNSYRITDMNRYMSYVYQNFYLENLPSQAYTIDRIWN